MTSRTLPSPNESIPLENGRANGLLQIAVVCRGVTPLLMNAMGVDELLAIRDKTNKKPKTAEKPRPRDEAESKLHRLPTGELHVPSTALFKCFINAGQYIRMDGKRQISTNDKSMLPGMMTLLTHPVILWKHGGEHLATWEVDIQQGRNPNGGEIVCLIRPRIDEWEFSFEVEVDTHQLPINTARKLIDLAGSSIGLLEFRPQRKGTFGRFRVDKWEIQEKE